MKYEVDLYYSGFITVPVDTFNEELAIDVAREEAARIHNKWPEQFIERFMPSLEVWREADTVRKIE